MISAAAQIDNYHKKTLPQFHNREKIICIWVLRKTQFDVRYSFSFLNKIDFTTVEQCGL